MRWYIVRKKGLRFFKRTEKFNGNWTVMEEKSRAWEKMYRDRWSHDKVVRTTHGVNCTGSCSWQVFVKNGIITWENQATDYPSCGPDMPEFEPRGCPRGASFSWYEYSPLRVKYPYVRGKLWRLWQNALRQYNNPVDAWASIVEDPEKAQSYKSARGKGGQIRVTWQEAYYMIAAMLIYTIKKYGPDRLAGFTPIPAMSMISYAAGSRFLTLLGGEMLSFYDWYADLPPASPQIWGEQTDVPESSDWYNAGYIMMWGSNVPLTRTPDAHFMTEVRYKGTKVVAVAPDYAENVKFADNWLAPNPGTDAALAQAMTHVILKEFYVERAEPLFIDYAKQFTDLPFLLLLDETEKGLTPGRFLRQEDLYGGLASESHADWKTCLIDDVTGEIVVPNGTMGQRWEDGVKWNLSLEREDGTMIQPAMTVGLDRLDTVAFPYFDNRGNGIFERELPVREITLADGSKRLVATVYDVMLSQYGVSRHAEDKMAARGLDDADSLYTPAWQEPITGVKADIVTQIAREFAQNAIDTGGRSMIIMGAGINHWFNSDTIYRSILNLVILTASQGVNGGGWAHYVGQEKCRPIEGWQTVAFAKDWQGAVRQQNATSFWYFATDQWRYEEMDTDALKSPLAQKTSYKHPADYNVLAARLGWLPSYPQFNKNSLLFAAENEGKSDAEIVSGIVDDLKNDKLQFAVEDPDNPVNFPRGLFVWRSNLVSSSGKGQEYFMKHLFGTTNNLLSTPNDEFKPEEIVWRDEEVEGKLDMMVTLDFRMTATPIYSDVVLPAATWYEKTDISSTDMHPFVHPFNPAISPLWESKSDWNIFKDLSQTFSDMAKIHLHEVQRDVVMLPLNHDSQMEISQSYGEIKDWKKGEVEAIPGKTMPHFQFVERDYTQIYDKFITLGPNVGTGKVGAHGTQFSVAEEYEEMKRINGIYEDDTIKNEKPVMETERQAANAILHISSATNGKVAVRAWKVAEDATGVELRDLAQSREAERITFESITAQPREVIPTPVFTGSNTDGKRYSPFTTNIERLVPFRTLTGRQHFYIDHEMFLQYGEALPVYKPTLPPQVFAPRDKQIEETPDTIVLRYLTPHGKWNIHSMYQDNQHMLTLFRGGPNVWINHEDAAAGNIKDNDWLEVYNRNGVVTARAVVSHRMPKGTMYMYHAQDRHINVPGTSITGTRGGSHNAPTKIHMKPTQMVGGYAQLSYGFNYYGPIGNQRDLYVAVRKLNEVNWLED
ncbi:nitrate reductase subunit alpha [Listeria booriae]|uniref:nitrate reductase (quinone) n=1 Tax=Listeria booriae TaxID=1552123 RepID=A0A7X0YWY6_9LIST|nr:nitrate reductase subunit alpha [Listeria booriae]MBC1793737.1 nitrate reductase subunit alpha [Listeria booriae]MBC1802088.1 nitrate reductase subunit alpha [Listeria booriae]MBC2165161.1 nitrate reductase subunit alpha [Listeria booriae]